MDSSLFSLHSTCPAGAGTPFTAKRRSAAAAATSARVTAVIVRSLLDFGRPLGCAERGPQPLPGAAKTHDARKEDGRQEKKKPLGSWGRKGPRTTRAGEAAINFLPQFVVRGHGPELRLSLPYIVDLRAVSMGRVFCFLANAPEENASSTRVH